MTASREVPDQAEEAQKYLSWVTFYFLALQIAMQVSLHQVNTFARHGPP